MVHCSLEVADLLGDSDYFAPSYTWGSPTYQAEQKGMTDQRRFPVLCNGRTLLVTENPFLFLRRATCAGTSEAWWIDAICINQEDVLERSGQVRKLGDIYAAAIKVIIWLGDEDEYTAPALQLLNILASVDTNKLVRADSLAQYDEAESKSRELLGMNIDQTYWTALSWFYKRHWFRRIWVLQECILSRGTIYICGTRLVDQDKPLHVTDYLLLSPRSLDRGFAAVSEQLEAPIVRACAHACLLLYNMAHQGRLYGSRLMTAIIHGRMCASSDPRDKVYALIRFLPLQQNVLSPSAIKICSSIDNVRAL
ncbi:MAG: hypothetical protein Q9171_004178 [Xanthocarpia ochracea]